MKKALLLSMTVAALVTTASAATPGDPNLPGGVVVHVGCEDADAVVALAANERCVVQALDTDPARVKSLQTALLSQRLHGRITAGVFDGRTLPYVDNLVNLMVIPNPGHKIPAAEIQRVLVPGGVAIVDGRKTVKPVPDSIDSWPHFLYGPENNAVSRDETVGISRNLQWIMPPSWGRHHNLVPSMSVMVSDGGRIYYIIDEAPIGVRGPTENWQLVCRDAFNGLLLWKRPMYHWGWKMWSAVETGGTMRFKRPDQLFRRLVADGDRVFVTLGFDSPVTAIDGRTGKTLKTCRGTDNTSAILYRDNVLYLAKNEPGNKPGKDFMAVDSQTGEILWERKGYRGITSRGDELKAFTDSYITLGRDNVFFLNEEEIVALDAKTGEDNWRSPRPAMEAGVHGHYAMEFKNYGCLVYHDGMVYLGQLFPSSTNLNSWQQKDMMIFALDANSGEKMWEHKGMSLAHFTPPDLFVNNGMVWTMRGTDVSLLGLDMKTGEVKKEYPAGSILHGHHHRCYRNRASKNLYLYGEEGIEYIDFRTGEIDIHYWMRGACAFGIMPANGLIYLPTHACGCHANEKLHGFIALANRSKQNSEVGGQKSEKLEKGTAYGVPIVSAAADPSTRNVRHASDWPMYRADAARSCSSDTMLSADLKQTWAVELDDALTQPVVLGKTVYVAGKDTHTVHALQMEDGTAQWNSIADGRIDSSPTCYQGRIFFGTRNGSVYCLRAADGELVWRFRAAPASRQLTSYGQLESVWPVHGSVLVSDGKVHCTAGRSTNLDGGIYYYELDAVTGKVLHEQLLSADTEVKGEVKGAVLSDILSSDGTAVYMRGVRLGPDGADLTRSGNRLVAQDGGLMDDTMFMSSYRMCDGVQAQLLAFDKDTAFGLMAQSQLVAKSYPQGIMSVGQGYRIFAAGLRAAPRETGNQANRKKQRRSKSDVVKRWQSKIPVRADSIVVAGDRVCFAGAPDVVGENDPWAAFKDRAGGVLLLVSKDDGAIVAEHKLDSSPVFDGMAAAQGRLFVSLKNGSLVCFGQ